MLTNLAPSVVPASPPPALDLPPIDIGFKSENTVLVNPDTGATHIENTDGSVTISFGPENAGGLESEFNENLAELLDESELSMMAEEILRGIDEDERSRKEWEDTYNRGIDLLGLKLEDPTSDVSASGNVSKVHHPLLIEAVVRYQANAQAELLPSAGPVKVQDAAPDMTPERVQMAEAFEKDFNHYLTVTRKEYYPDTRRMLFAQGFCGNGFKKVYRCPLRKAPVSDYVAAKDLIVSNDAVSLFNVSRITHRTTMRHSVMKRLQINGHYRKCELTQPVSQPTLIDMKIAQVEGINKTIGIPADHPYTLYETYTEYDIPSFAHKDDNDEPTGLPLPYRFTLDKDSRKILEIRRNYKESDKDCMPRQRFVKYGYIPGLGFYDYGLVHLLGQTARALTAIERQLIDAGQFSNFPGLLLSDVGGRQETTQIRVPPGGAHTIKTGGMPIGQVVMALPYKEPSGVLVNIAKAVEDNGRRLGGTAEVNVGEGRADVPVGTTIALIEQSTKVQGAVHKQNHESQQQEFLLLKELFEEDPEALTRFAKTPARKWQSAQEIADQNLVPASDPNTPSHIHRVMKATGLSQLATTAPQLYNLRAVHSILVTTLGYSPQAVLNPVGMPQQGPSPDPAKMGKIALDQERLKEKQQASMVNTQLKIQKTKTDMEDRAAERESRENIQKLKTMGSLIQQQNQQEADERKQTMGFRSEVFGRHQDHKHTIIEQAHDHRNALREQQDKNQKDLSTQDREHAHQKEIAKSKSNVVTSSES